MEASSRSVAMVVGAGKGIGRATVLELAAAGCHVAAVARTAVDLARTAEAAQSAATGVEVLQISADATDVDAIQKAVDQTVERFGRIDALVNSAGLAPMLTIEQTTPELWRQVMDANLNAVFYACRAAWPHFKRQSGGVIVNVSSFSARDPFAGFLAYGSAKAAVNLFSLALNREGKPHNIRVHTVAPAAVETGMLRKLFPADQLPTESTLAPEAIARVIVQCITGPLAPTAGEVVWVSR
jgi:NAD(P)-dependent dehydrogenase (short-subunit alcohol dehydrogenase family)